jgi:hypothetical protein
MASLGEVWMSCTEVAKLRGFVQETQKLCIIVQGDLKITYDSMAICHGSFGLHPWLSVQFHYMVCLSVLYLFAIDIHIHLMLT